MRLDEELVPLPAWVPRHVSNEDIESSVWLLHWDLTVLDYLAIGSIPQSPPQHAISNRDFSMWWRFIPYCWQRVLFLNKKQFDFTDLTRLASRATTWWSDRTASVLVRFSPAKTNHMLDFILPVKGIITGLPIRPRIEWMELFNRILIRRQILKGLVIIRAPEKARRCSRLFVRYARKTQQK
jgi:hypothetical protein